MFKKLFQSFNVPTAEQLARKELEQAKRELLSAQSNAEYYTRMVDYNIARIKRLQKVESEA
jgi:hypothetical protein